VLGHLAVHGGSGKGAGGRRVESNIVARGECGGEGPELERDSHRDLKDSKIGFFVCLAYCKQNYEICSSG
jgi:hypothetical protein